MLLLQNVGYTLPDKHILFNNIHLSLQANDKVALIGNNGSGKSTLLKIIAGEYLPAEGSVDVAGTLYYVPQITGQYNSLTVAQALRIEDKLAALKEILDGRATEVHFDVLNDDWTLEERCGESLGRFGLAGLDLDQKMGSLSGGQKTKVFLAGISIHQPDLVLLDEPSNHLDAAGRALLYALIRSTQSAFLVVSHDRKLLNLLGTTLELSNGGISVYGGNYDFYTVQKQTESVALEEDVKAKEKALRKAREKERETLERQQKLDARGKKKQEKAGVARIMLNTLKNNAEKSTSKIKSQHAEKIGDIAQELRELRAALPEWDKMKFGFGPSAMHPGKRLLEANGINYSYGGGMIWKEHLHFQLASGERIAINGLNGSGKTTLLKIILGSLDPSVGTVFRADNQSSYIDQDYSLMEKQMGVYEQVQQFNTAGLQEHELKIRLSRFLFSKDDWEKPCTALSGGEKMRLMLCCLTVGTQAPDMIVLDEPTNNLDVQNIDILTAALNEYPGTLLVVSHDESFLNGIRIGRHIWL